MSWFHVITLALPEALLLAVPAGLAWWLLARSGSGKSSGQWWRLAVLAVLVLAASAPEAAWGRGGSDVVLVLDRSASMPDGERAQQAEFIEQLARQRRRGDRLAVVAMADGAVVVQAPSAEARPRVGDISIADGASDLAAGIDLAMGLIAVTRSGRVIVHSDGDATAADPRQAAARLNAHGIRLDVLIAPRPDAPDAAVVAVEIPGQARLGESFIGAARFIGDRRESRAWQVVRIDARINAESVEHVLASGTVALVPGVPATVTFADRPPQPGLVRYRVDLDDHGDRLTLNNHARAALRVAGGERVLVMGGDGTPGNLARALSAAGIQVTTRTEGALTLDELLACRALVLEQVPADRLGPVGLNAVATWVEHLGGGLVMTGGRRSFGAGGYHRSAVERVLPVTMELRDEHRRLRVAMAVCLDRSGSMSMSAGGGRTKMDLADEGAAAAVELLGPLDQMAVFAVDTSAHVIVPMTAATDPAGIARRVRHIESEGGGIYIYEALLAGGKELAKAGTAGARHLLLFADASDSEEPGDYRTLVDAYRAAGITVSVIGMGTPKDSDAALLEDIAKRGGGRCTFALDPADIPRLFAQETVLIARSTWIDQAVSLKPQAALASVLGLPPGLDGAWPTIAGYNLTYPRDRAQVLSIAPGDPLAPAVATWRIGTGRSAAVMVDADDPAHAEFTAWPGYAPLFAGLVRWSAGAGGHPLGALTATRSNDRAIVRLELDPDRRADWPVLAPTLVLAGAQGQASRQMPMQPVDDGVFEALVRLDDQPVIPAVALGTADFSADSSAQSILGPALQLPYSPEAEPRFERARGAEVMTQCAALTGGSVRGDLLDAFANPPSCGEVRSLTGLLLLLALPMLLAEIAVRRWGLGWPSWRRRRQSEEPSISAAESAKPPPPASPPLPSSQPAASPTGGLHEALRDVRRRR